MLRSYSTITSYNIEKHRHLKKTIKSSTITLFTQTYNAHPTALQSLILRLD